MSKENKTIKELETLLSFTNVDLNDDYYRGAKGVATMALKAIKELKKEFISSKVDYSIEKNEIIEGLLQDNKELQEADIELQEENRSLVDQHEAEIMYYTGKIADFTRQVELLEKERTLALEMLVRFEEENKQLQEEVEKHKNAFEQSAEEGKEIIAELKAENEKLRGNTDRVGIFKSLNY